MPPRGSCEAQTDSGATTGETLNALTSRIESSEDSTRGEREWRDAEDEEAADSYSPSADHEECFDMEYGSDAECGANSDE